MSDERNLGGRPSKYDPAMCALVRNYAKLGATEQQIAEFIGISRSNLSIWKIQHEEFAAALSDGKLSADDQVEQSLFRRATGYRHVAFKMFQHEGRVITKRYIEHYPPDTTACIFWLKNRRREQWRDVREHDFKGKVSLEQLVTGVAAEDKSDA